jgi:creatinine amidohydrolase
LTTLPSFPAVVGGHRLPTGRTYAALTTEELRALLEGPRPVAVLLPVGSVEPHGPHLPLGTDTYLSEAAAERAVPLLEQAGVVGLVAPSIPYGVTDFAEGFAGAVSLPAEALTAFLRAVVAAHLRAGAAHVCLVNNHLEPAHDTAVRAALEGLAPAQASVACPLSRRWARTLSDEFKSGACHAGRYETSLVLAARPGEVHLHRARALPEVPISLSDGIRAGKHGFREMGMSEAYAGAPAQATADEGEALYAKLAAMVATEVLEALGVVGQAG